MPLPVDGRNQERRLAAGLGQRLRLLLQRRLVEHVDLRQRDDFRLVGQFAAIGFELVLDGLVGLADIFFLRGDEMQQHAGALDMAEEAVAEADAFMGAFDQARNVGQDEFAAVDGRDAEIRDAAS